MFACDMQIVIDLEPILLIYEEKFALICKVSNIWTHVINCILNPIIATIVKFI